MVAGCRMVAAGPELMLSTRGTAGGCHPRVPPHDEIGKYCQSTSKVHALILQDLRVPPTPCERKVSSAVSFASARLATSANLVTLRAGSPGSSAACGLSCS